MLKYYLTFFSFLIFGSLLFAQVEMPRVSPKASVSQNIGYTTITIDYSRPGVKERKIWGGLVPYNKVWRAGANESTRLRFTTDVIIEGNKVPAGIYSLYFIPAEDEWTVIINKALLWGTQYKEEEDLLRFKTKPQSAPFTERLEYTIPVLSDSSCSVVVNWENLQISFVVSVDLVNQVYAKINEAIARANSDEWQVYVLGANFAAENGVFIEEAFRWIDKAISLSKNFNCFLAKARLYYKTGKYTEALKTIELCREAGSSDNDYQNHIAEVDLLEQRIKNQMR